MLAGTSKAEEFDAKIAPLFAQHCLSCHSGHEPKGGLDLSQKTTATAGGESGEAWVAGKPAESLLWEYVSTDEMPPKHPLAKEEKELLKAWIADGANWGTEKIDPFRFSTEHRGGYDWWSLQPLHAVVPPAAQPADWARNEIDRFILQKLNENQLTPSAEASPRVLVRRLYFDLVGLPPPPEVVAAFENNPSEEAYRKLVDDLLASPHYGERWGRHWLDVARYGESDGFERNTPRNNSWHYRDWTINAFNSDMPYDEFVRLQIAGDLLQEGKSGAAAAGFLVAGVHNTVVGSSERMQKLARQDELEEIIGTVGQTFLGLTVQCARCHDHKFDPIPQSEYYAMIAAIDGVQHGERRVRTESHQEERNKLQEELKQIEQRLAKIDEPARQAVRQERENGQNQPDPPAAYAQWEFEGDLKDSIGALHGEIVGNAKIENGALVLDGNTGYARTAPLAAEIAEKTLESWVLLENADQRGGASISLETNNGGVFDAIVFGEREPRRWMAGSNSFVRTSSFGGAEETEATQQPVHIAIVYQADGTITSYRNGVVYGSPYKTGFQKFSVGDAHIAFGLRHLPAGGNKMLSGKILRASLYNQALSAEEIAASFGIETNFVSEKAIVAKLSPEAQQERGKIKEEIARIENQLRQLSSGEEVAVYTVNPRNPGVMKIHIRGDVVELGETVKPAGVAAIVGPQADFGLAENASDRERRKQLADWITAKNNPLFTRVIVNRLWHYHFGVGIVATPNDFGFNGGRPSHPDLLDWLAERLKQEKYSLKAMQRLIVTSAAYRQSSALRKEAFAKDAGNRLLWRRSPQRVDAEALRDAILQTAGEMNPAMGGPGYVDVAISNNNGTTYYEANYPQGSQYDRRTIYRFVPRGGRSSLLDTFDCPDPSATAPRRSVTTTPLQALSLLNSPFVLRMADSFAARVQAEAGENINDQVAFAYRLALLRDPRENEAKLAATLVEKHGLDALCRALFNSNEFVVVD